MATQRFTRRDKPAPPPDMKALALEARVKALQDEIDAADAEHRKHLAVRDGDYAHLRKTHLAASLVWNLRSTMMFERGNHDAARKAATTANEHAALAAKLERDSLADRVRELEEGVNHGRSLGRDLEGLDEE